jgi:hypothetical protein
VVKIEKLLIMVYGSRVILATIVFGSCFSLDLASDIFSLDVSLSTLVTISKAFVFGIFVVSACFEIFMLAKIQRHPLMNVAENIMTEPDKPSIIAVE